MTRGQALGSNTGKGRSSLAPAAALLPCLLLAACASTASTAPRAPGSIDSQVTAVPVASQAARAPVPARAAEPASLASRRTADPAAPGGCRQGESVILSGRRAAATFPYVPRRLACEDVARIARQAAARAGLEAGLLVGVIRVESAFAVNAISSAAAIGLSQVMPAVGEKLACGDLFDPEANAACGATVLARWLARFDGNLVSALSGYNAGHGMPTRARAESRIPKNFQYVEDVLRQRSRFLRLGCRAWETSPTR